MKERGILFSAPMVRALLAGTKTQTRRTVKWRGLEPGLNLQFSGLSVERSGSNFVLTSPTRDSHAYRSVPQPCPYGLPGDRLWVREAFRVLDCWNGDSPAKVGDLCLNAGYSKPWAPTQYEADGDRANWMSVGTLPGVPIAGKLRPGIHMPRWASRLTLEVTDVRVERLQEISEADAQAEGSMLTSGSYSHRGWYRELWDEINGAGSWDANPWVWVVSFRRVG